MNCKEKKYEENDAKNKALHMTTQARRHRPKTGSAHGQSRAYYCKDCKAWHVKTETSKIEVTQEPCQPLSSIAA
jgi:hypothetical protein